MAVKCSVAQDVFLLPLTDDGAPNVPNQYIFLKAPTSPAYVVRFEIEGTSSICRQGSLWVNIPEPDGVFRRDYFREYKWVIWDPKESPIDQRGLIDFPQNSMGPSISIFLFPSLELLPSIPPLHPFQISRSSMLQLPGLLGLLPITLMLSRI